MPKLGGGGGVGGGWVIRAMPEFKRFLVWMSSLYLDIPLIPNHDRDAGGSGGNMASYFGRQQSVASMASLPPDEVEFELDLEV